MFQDRRRIPEHDMIYHHNPSLQYQLHTQQQQDYYFESTTAAYTGSTTGVTTQLLCSATPELKWFESA